MAELIVSGETYRRKIGVIPVGILLGAATHALNVLAFWLVGRAVFPYIPSLGDHFRIVPLRASCSAAIPCRSGRACGAEVSSSFQRPSDPRRSRHDEIPRLLAAIASGVYLANLTQMRALREAARRLVEETELVALAADAMVAPDGPRDHPPEEPR